jgi:hypothetical protein
MPKINLGKVIPTINNKVPQNGTLTIKAEDIPFDEDTSVKEQINDLDAEKATKVELEDGLDLKADKLYMEEKLATKRDKETKLELEDLSATILSAIEGGEGTTFNLLSVPQDGSVTKEKVSADFLKVITAPTTNGNTLFEYENDEIISIKEYLNGELIREKRMKQDIENKLAIFSEDNLAKTKDLYQYNYDENGNLSSINTLKVVKNYAPFDYFIANGMKRIFGTEMSLNSNHTIAPLDLSGYSNIAFVVKNEHDAELNIQLYSSVNLTSYIASSIPVTDVHEKIHLGYIVVPPKTTFIVDKETLPQINEDYVGMFFMVGRRTVPTEGNVEVIFFAQ